VKKKKNKGCGAKVKDITRTTIKNDST